ncbi:unnamed protein product [Closterium sp. Naga37s-1]|nr:unnamed protein product [Closterium sp. Naga37s-1]
MPQPRAPPLRLALPPHPAFPLARFPMHFPPCALQWIPRMSPCPVAGLAIEELDEHLNFRRGYTLGFVDDVEDKTQILAVLRAVLDPAMHASVTWFLQSYPLDFTKIHAVEVRQGVLQVPAPSHKTIRANMSARNRLCPLHTGPADFPLWLLARVHPPMLTAVFNHSSLPIPLFLSPPVHPRQTIRANMSARSRLCPLHTGPTDFPLWLLARVHSPMLAAFIDHSALFITSSSLPPPIIRYAAT